MTTFQVKTESLAVRCDVCHQADRFDPATGVCTRCAEITNVKGSNRNDLWILRRYIGPRAIPLRIHLRNAFLGGISCAGLHLFFIPVIGLWEKIHPVTLVIAGCFMLGGMVGGFLMGRKLRSRTTPFTFAEQREYGIRAVFWPTAVLTSQSISAFWVLTFTGKSDQGLSEIFGIILFTAAFTQIFIWMSLALALIPAIVLTHLDRDLCEPVK